MHVKQVTYWRSSTLASSTNIWLGGFGNPAITRGSIKHTTAVDWRQLKTPKSIFDREHVTRRYGYSHARSRWPPVNRQASEQTPICALSACNGCHREPLSETRAKHAARSAHTTSPCKKDSEGGQRLRRVDPIPVALTCLCPTLPHSGWATLFPETATKCFDARSGAVGRGEGCREVRETSATLSIP